MGRGSRIMIFVIYWECISLGAGTRLGGGGESYNLLGICVVAVVVVWGVLRVLASIFNKYLSFWGAPPLAPPPPAHQKKKTSPPPPLLLHFQNNSIPPTKINLQSIHKNVSDKIINFLIPTLSGPKDPGETGRFVKM